MRGCKKLGMSHPFPAQVDDAGLFDDVDADVVHAHCNDGEIKEILFKFAQSDARRAKRQPPRASRAVMKLQHLLLDKFDAMGGNMRVAVKHTLGTYDTDGSGELEKQECVKALSSLLPGITDDEIGVLVDLIDTDKSETLTVDEITDFLLDSHKNRDAQETSLHFG